MAAPPPLAGGAPPPPPPGGGGGDAAGSTAPKGGGGGGGGGVPGPLLPRPGVASLNAHLSCPLCKGYLVDATTLLKCLHSFCRSCILKHLDSGHHNCPVCDVRLSKMNMEGLLMKDDTLQNVVYKAVPGLYQKEMKRRRDFYSSKGSKGDQGSLTPEQKGELDSSSAGRIIFSPDEAVSLSLEYKPIVTVKTEPEASTAGTSPAQAIKEPAKRYLNCPAAVTIGLLQKFLRMKYSISSRYKVDILYTDDVLWSKYTLMDVAYIYTWKRDMPLQLFYRVTENAPKPAVAIASVVVGRTSASDMEQSPPQQGLVAASSSVESGIHARSAATLSQSASVVQESRGCKEEEVKEEETTELGTAKLPVQEAAGKLREDKPSVDSASIAEAKVQNKTADAAPASTAALGAATTESKVAEQVPDISGAPNKAFSLPTTTKRPLPRGAEVGKARTDNALEERTVISPPSKPVAVAASNHPDDQRVTDKPTLCIPVKVLPLGLPRNVGSVSGSIGETTLCEDLTTPLATDDEAASGGDTRATATISVKASVRVEGGSSARTAGFVLRQPPSTKVTRPLNGLDKGISQALVNCTTGEGTSIAEDETTKKDSSDDVLGGAVPLDDKTPKKPLDFVLGIRKSVEDEASETKNVQTCISRAAHKAEAKLNALKAAAAALQKDTSQPERDSKETGGLSVTLRANRISGRSHSEDSADKRLQRSGSQGDLAKTEPPTSKTPPARVVTPPLPVMQTYLTMSKSHPSLFHLSPRKRGRPKLATVNSLNEEIERAHMLSQSEIAAAAVGEKPKPPLPPIPVITSLKIKPIPPPPSPGEQQVEAPSPTDLPKEPAYRSRSKSQGDLSEEKSDAEDSTGRRTSRRRVKTIATQLEELSVEKGQAATQKPLLSPSGSTSASKAPPPIQGQEKITLRVTRDEKCNLKVEKQLRPAVVSETLHDSGFCEDVVAEPAVTPSSVPDQKEKAGHHKAVQNQNVTSNTSGELDQIGSPRHTHHGTKKDLRKSKRKSVEDWVNEQSKWVRTHEEEAAKQQGLMNPPEGKARKGGESSQKPASPAFPKEPPPPPAAKTTQRRGRKRTNPVKITKPGTLADAQQGKSAGAPLPHTQGSSEMAEVTSVPPRIVIDKEQGSDVAPKAQGSCHSPRGKSRQEPEHTKKSPELVIPRYIPNAATSVPLTVTHARNKRLRETDRSALSSQDTSGRIGAATGSESPEKDSEKSKFFKEALNLSMKETETETTSISAQREESSAEKLPERVQKGSLEESQDASPAAVNQSETVTKRVDPPPKDGAASQLRTTHKVAERAAFRNSTKVPEKQQDATLKSTVVDDIEKQKNSRDEGGIRKGGRSLRSPPNMSKNKPAPVPGRTGTTSVNKNSSTGVLPNPGSKATITSANIAAVSEARSPSVQVQHFAQPLSLTQANNAKAPVVISSVTEMKSAEQAQNLMHTSHLRAMDGVNTPLNVLTVSEARLSEQSLKSPQAQISSSISPTCTVGPEILPRINETGVFRLEFPVAEPPRKPSPLPETKDNHREAPSPALSTGERLLVSRTPPCVSREMSESVRNIVLVQESMMESRQASRGLPCLRKEPNGEGKAAQRLSPRASPAPSTTGISGENPLALKTEPLVSKNAVRNVSHSPAMHSRLQSSPKPPFVNDVKIPVHELGSLFNASTNKGVPGSPVARDCSRVPDVGGVLNAQVAQRLLALANLPMLKVPNDTSSCRKEKVDLMRIESDRVRGSPSPVRSPVASFDARGTNTNKASPYSVASLVRTVDVRVGGNQKGFWRPVDICTLPEQLPAEAALQKIAANKHISIGRAKDTRPQATARNEQKVSPQIPSQSLSVSIVTCSSTNVRMQANHVSHIPHPSAQPNVPRQLNISSERQDLRGKPVTQRSSGARTGDSFLSHSPSLSHRLPDAFRTLKTDRRGGLAVPSSLTVCETSPQKGSPSPPTAHSPARSSTVLGERLSPSIRVDRLDQPCNSPRPSCKGLLSPTGVPSGRPEVHSSSSEELHVARIDKTSAMASPKASENMYRTTVAEIDLFTTLSIIDTMKGKATVHDIIDDYITNLGSFFCTLETASAESRRAVEDGLASKHDKLLKVIGLLKKLTSDLTSGQLTRVVALEALVERFLLRCRTSATPLPTEDGPIALPEWGVSTTSAVLQQVRLADVKEEPLTQEPYVDPDPLAVLGEHFSYALLRKSTLKRLKYGLKLRDLLGPRRQLASVLLPPQVSICRRFLPRRPGGCFPRGPLFRRGRISCLPPRPAASLCLPAKRLAGLLPCGSFRLPPSTVIVDALSSLLTGLLPNLVNPGAPMPRNGQHLIEPTITTTTATATLALTPVAEGALGCLEEPRCGNFELTLFSALSRLLSGQLDSRGQLPKPPVHLWNQVTELVPNRRQQSRELAGLPRCTLLVEATSESSLVISSPQSNSKLVIGPEVNRQLLSRLLDGLQFIPKSRGRGPDVRSWLNNNAGLAIESQRGGHCRMLTNCAEAPDQRLSAAALGSSSNACMAEPLPKPLAKPLAKPEGAVTRRFLRKRALAAVSKAPILDKRRRLTSNVVEQSSGQSRPASVSAPEKPQAVSKDCVVVLHRLELLDMKEIMLKRRRSLRFRGGSAQPKKKPKLSVFPKALSGVQR